jgi:hypothetical protein
MYIYIYEMIIDMGKPKYSKRNLSQCHQSTTYRGNKGSNPYCRRESPEMWHGLDVHNSIQFDSILAVGRFL